MLKYKFIIGIDAELYDKDESIDNLVKLAEFIEYNGALIKGNKTDISHYGGQIIHVTIDNNTFLYGGKNNE